jgi:hypothetical protein
MFKLIVKDLVALKDKWVFVLIWLIFASSTNVMAAPVGYISLGLLLAPLGASEKYKTDSLYCSLPIKRSSIVYSKYMGALVFFASVLVATYMLFLVRMQFVTGEEKLFSMHHVFAVFFPYVIFLSALLPLYFKYGLELGKNFGSIMGGVFLGVVIAAIIFLYAYPQGSVFALKYAYVYLSIGMVIAMAISLKCSLMFYSKREF